MPEFTVKEVRLPELHLPEIHREEIVRTLSGVRLPEVDLARARRAKIRVPAVNLSANDIGRIIGAGAAITRFVRPGQRRSVARWNPFRRAPRSPIAMISRSRNRRSRRPIVLALLVFAVAAIWAILRRPANQRRIEVAAREARERFATWRAQELRPTTELTDDVTATDAEMLAIGNATANDAAPPEDGAVERTGATDDVPAFEESQTPA